MCKHSLTHFIRCDNFGWVISLFNLWTTLTLHLEVYTCTFKILIIIFAQPSYYNIPIGIPYINNYVNSPNSQVHVYQSSCFTLLTC